MTMKNHSRKLQLATAVTALAALGGISTSHAAELSSLSSSTLQPGTHTPETPSAPDAGTASEELLVNVKHSSVNWYRNVQATLGGTPYPHSYVATNYPITNLTVDNAPEYGFSTFTATLGFDEHAEHVRADYGVLTVYHDGTLVDSYHVARGETLEVAHRFPTATEEVRFEVSSYSEDHAETRNKGFTIATPRVS